MDMEWKAIIAQNKGKGVVLAATWVSYMYRGYIPDEGTEMLVLSVTFRSFL